MIGGGNIPVGAIVREVLSPGGSWLAPTATAGSLDAENSTRVDAEIAFTGQFPLDAILDENIPATHSIASPGQSIGSMETPVGQQRDLRGRK